MFVARSVTHGQNGDDIWDTFSNENVYIFITLGHHWRRRVLPSFHASGRQSVPLSVFLSAPNDVTALTLQGFQLWAWQLVGWCTVPWSRSIFKMTILGQFLHVSRNFEIFHDSLGSDMRKDVTALWGFQLLVRNLEFLSVTCQTGVKP